MGSRTRYDLSESSAGQQFGQSRESVLQDSNLVGFTSTFSCWHVVTYLVRYPQDVVNDTGRLVDERVEPKRLASNENTVRDAASTTQENREPTRLRAGPQHRRPKLGSSMLRSSTPEGSPTFQTIKTPTFRIIGNSEFTERAATSYIGVLPKTSYHHSCGHRQHDVPQQETANAHNERKGGRQKTSRHFGQNHLGSVVENSPEENCVIKYSCHPRQHQPPTQRET